jgi:hypothetical protein
MVNYLTFKANKISWKELNCQIHYVKTAVTHLRNADALALTVGRLLCVTAALEQIR